MGIKQLNKFIRLKCNDKLNKKHFTSLYKKKVCIDTMIYIYKYIREETLLESFYKMCLLFRKYNIIPLFVFDGNVPLEKKFEIKRRQDKKEIIYNKLIELQNKKTLTNDETIIKKEFEKSILKPNNKDIEDVKSLIKLCGYNYIIAEKEADELCVQLVIKKKVFACISDDMDMFVYKCPRVIRHFNIKHDSFVLYDLKDILNALDMTFENFKWLCILSGTDYHKYYNKKINIFCNYKKFKKYNKIKTDLDYYNWMIDNNYIPLNEDYKQIYNMFNIEKKEIKNISITNGFLNINDIYKLLTKELFLNPLTLSI